MKCIRINVYDGVNSDLVSDADALASTNIRGISFTYQSCLLNMKDAIDARVHMERRLVFN